MQALQLGAWCVESALLWISRLFDGLVIFVYLARGTLPLSYLIRAVELPGGRESASHFPSPYPYDAPYFDRPRADHP